MWPWIAINFPIIKPTRCTNFSDLFWNETLHVSDSSSAHHQELFDVHSAMVYQSWSCSKAVYKPVWHIPLLSLQWITPDDGQRNCPRHVKFFFQNKFEKLVHLFGFIMKKNTTCLFQYITIGLFFLLIKESCFHKSWHFFLLQEYN
jgi:hypothetical protein